MAVVVVVVDVIMVVVVVVIGYRCVVAVVECGRAGGHMVTHVTMLLLLMVT